MAIKDWPGGVISKTPVVPAGSFNNSAASGVWTLDQVAYWQKQGVWPNPANIPGDPYYEYVSLLLTGDGTNGAQNNTFLDSSTNAYSITRNGNTTQGTFSPYGNLWSNYFEAVGQYLTPSGTPSAIVGTLNGSTNLCIECWIFPTAYNTTAYPAIIGDMSPTTEVDYWSFGINASGQVTMYWYTGTGVLCYSTSAVTLNTWSHIAVNINAGAITLYINGVSQSLNGTTTLGTVAGSLGYLIIGQWNNGGAGSSGRFVGYISNLRVTKASVYTSSFTPSTTPLTAISGTSLLTCQSNRFIDNSSNNFTLTVNGNTSVQRFSPFNPTAPYSAATIGGSGYFDGTDQLLTSPAVFSSLAGVSTSYTVEFWIYLQNHTDDIGEVLNMDQAGDTSGTFAYVTNTGVFAFSNAGAGNYTGTETPSGSFPLNAWTHLCMSKSGSTMRLFVNGVVKATNTITIANLPSYPNTYIGARNGLGRAIIGYLCDLRVVNGTALYTSDFTPPTAPLTAVAGTGFLESFTNAGIPDAAMMNDLETVGNAQVSTSVVKYGTGSLAFDGTGDWLVGPSIASNSLGSGDFTIEGWVYTGNTSSRSGIVGNRTGSGGDTVWCIDLNPTNVGSWGYIYFHTDATAIVGSSTNYSANTWFHIAVTRSGTTMRMFLNGTQVGTATSSVNLTASNIYVGAEGSRTDQSSPLNGYIDDLRITKGYARYTANFTPPTAAFPTF